MNAPKKTDAKVDPAVVAGFAVGVGITFVATLGVYWRYAQPGTGPFVSAGVTFLVGALIGAVWTLVRRTGR